VDQERSSCQVALRPQRPLRQWRYFKKQFACIVQALDRLSHSVNKKEAAETRGLLMQFKLLEVIFFLHVFDDLLSVTQHLSLQLQASQLDIGACRRLLDGIQKTINDKRTDHGFEQSGMMQLSLHMKMKSVYHLLVASVRFESRLR